MSNTSKKHRNKKIWQILIALLVIILVGSFIISRKDKTVDPSAVANVETFADAAHIKGNAEAQIRLIEYSDFQCPACKGALPVVNSLVDAMGDQFVLEYRHFPLVQIHPNATLAAQAAEAAAVQGKFWEMHDMLFDNQSEWSQSFNPEKFFREYAVAIGINEDRFRADLRGARQEPVPVDLAPAYLRATRRLRLHGDAALHPDRRDHGPGGRHPKPHRLRHVHRRPVQGWAGPCQHPDQRVLRWYLGVGCR